MDPVTSDMASTPLMVIVVGAGAMGGVWVKMLASCANAALVGLVDLDLMLARKVIDDEGLTGVVVGSSLEEVAGRTDAGAVINVTVPQAHRVVNETALRAGLHVLCEKPLGLTLGDALRQVALADLTRGLLMVSQSRRYFNNLSALRDAVQQLGALGTITTEFFHCDHEPGFREQMAQPLLFDMSIHHFDALRFVTGEEANAVRCSAWNPPWSWYAGAASATAEFELSSGARYVYAGSRCTPGLPTSWNGTWHVHAELGAAHWDGDHPPEIDAEGVNVAVPAGEEQIAGAFAEFVNSLRTGTTPQNEVRDNVMSLAMVEGAVMSARTGNRVVIADLLEASYARAIADEERLDVRDRLQAWGTAQAGIATGHWGVASRLP